MLLLVLILVLVAFGLLVVALLTGNVLCAWLSVAVSVAAAVVLVVDWLQRRSAVKAGAAEAGAPSAMASPEVLALSEPDPVTEVLPVVPPLADHGGARSTEDDTRIDRPVDGQQTVIMPAVQPSGSAARPSGAEGATTSLGGSPSPSVTEKARDQTAVEDSRATSDSRGGDAEATVSVDIRKAGADGRKPDAPVVDTPDPATQAAGATDRSGDETTASDAPEGDRSRIEPSGAAGAVAAGAAAAAAASTASAAPSAPSSLSADSPDKSSADDGAPREEEESDVDSPTVAAAASSETRSDVSDEQTVMSPVNTVKGGAARPDGRAAEPESPQASSPGEEARFAESETTISTASADAANAAPAAAERAVADRVAERSAPGGAPVDQSARATFGGPASPGHELFDPVDRSAAAGSAPPPSGAVENTAVMSAASSTRQVDESEPPEEPLDPAAARIVARLEDEVLVIDEQPRYHVARCRAVTAHATIPLPAREAIELGFTPCGWCTPDAVLADRHRASAQP